MEDEKRDGWGGDLRGDSGQESALRFSGGGCLSALHERICSGEIEAREVLASALLEPLTRRLSRSFPYIDPEFLWDGATQSIMDYLDHPMRFDPARGHLEMFLYTVAWRHVRGLCRRELRRREREQLYLEYRDGQALPPRESLGEAKDSTRLGSSRNGAWLDRFLALLSDRERAAMHLWLQGERRTLAFAKALGIDSLSAKDQRAEVYRAKWRLRKAAQRFHGSIREALSGDHESQSEKSSIFSVPFH